MADPCTPVDVPLRRPCCLAGRPHCPLDDARVQARAGLRHDVQVPNITGFTRPTLNQSLLAFGPDHNGRLPSRHRLGARAAGPHPGSPRLAARMRASGPRSPDDQRRALFLRVCCSFATAAWAPPWKARLQGFGGFQATNGLRRLATSLPAIRESTRRSSGCARREPTGDTACRYPPVAGEWARWCRSTVAAGRRQAFG